MLSLENLPFSAPKASAGRSQLTGLVSLGLHALALLAVIALPLLLEEALPEQARAARAFFAEPISLAPPPAPPPPAPAARAVARVPASRDASTMLLTPVEVPTEIVPEDGLDLGGAGLPGGVEGGVPGGVVGGVVGGLPEAPPPPPQQPLRVGKDIRAPRKLKDVAPIYPEFARLAGLQGVVVVQCVIDERGRVQDAKLVRGPRLLDDAALEAVRQWVYAPSLLNGVPVPVLMDVTVTFQLAGR